MRTLLCILLLFISISLDAQQRHPQTSFGEGDIHHPVKLPKGAIRALNRTVKDHNRDYPCQYAASAIDLNDDSIEDYVVQATGGNCMGGDNVHYWIVWHDSTRYRVVLDYGVSALFILKTKTNGFYDIRTTWDIAAEGSTELWKFSHGSYRIVRRWYRNHDQ